MAPPRFKTFYPTSPQYLEVDKVDSTQLLLRKPAEEASPALEASSGLNKGVLSLPFTYLSETYEKGLRFFGEAKLLITEQALQEVSSDSPSYATYLTASKQAQQSGNIVLAHWICDLGIERYVQQSMQGKTQDNFGVGFYGALASLNLEKGRLSIIQGNHESAIQYAEIARGYLNFWEAKGQSAEETQGLKEFKKLQVETVEQLVSLAQEQIALKESMVAGQEQTRTEGKQKWAERCEVAVKTHGVLDGGLYAMGGAKYGAGIGTAVGGPVGTLIGGGLGVVIGFTVGFGKNYFVAENLCAPTVNTIDRAYYLKEDIKKKGQKALAEFMSSGAETITAGIFTWAGGWLGSFMSRTGTRPVAANLIQGLFLAWGDTGSEAVEKFTYRGLMGEGWELRRSDWNFQKFLLEIPFQVVLANLAFLEMFRGGRGGTSPWNRRHQNSGGASTAAEPPKGPKGGDKPGALVPTERPGALARRGEGADAPQHGALVRASGMTDPDDPDDIKADESGEEESNEELASRFNAVFPYQINSEGQRPFTLIQPLDEASHGLEHGFYQVLDLEGEMVWLDDVLRHESIQVEAQALLDEEEFLNKGTFYGPKPTELGLRWFTSYVESNLASLLDSEIFTTLASQGFYPRHEELMTEIQRANHSSLHPLPTSLADQLRQIDEVMLNNLDFAIWFVQLTQETLREMKGTVGRETLSSQAFQVNLLKKLEERGRALGFTGLSVIEHEETIQDDETYFFSQLAQGRLVVEAFGNFIGNDRQMGQLKEHGAMVHIIQAVYMAERVEGFVELYRFMGRDSEVGHFLWENLFDSRDITFMMSKPDMLTERLSAFVPAVVLSVKLSPHGPYWGLLPNGLKLLNDRLALIEARDSSIIVQERALLTKLLASSDSKELFQNLATLRNFYTRNVIRTPKGGLGMVQQIDQEICEVGIIDDVENPKRPSVSTGSGTLSFHGREEQAVAIREAVLASRKARMRRDQHGIAKTVEREEDLIAEEVELCKLWPFEDNGFANFLLEDVASLLSVKLERPVSVEEVVTRISNDTLIFEFPLLTAQKYRLLNQDLHRLLILAAREYQS
ncbi:MAG: hypothetical protein KDK66_06700, partial [Deltaproteobacteria bacterium]|nr:hypothetical protein [Deltaproteobacteria bacterium]